jgi:DNA mismatch repair protein MutL
MSKIQRLPENIANQIAAGEVIQRPASVIKELMENAIDADASEIIINIKDAGKTLIQVIDNGHGMSDEDAVICFERHATSKIRKADDLFALATKGFRGEALASIAAIAHVELKTRLKDDDTGTVLTVEGSVIKDQNEAVCPIGTSFEIKNLFFNVPARRNFLKSDNVEFNHIREEFERVALAHPTISFKLIHNESIIYDLKDTVLRKRIVDILGRNSNDRLVPIEEQTDIVSLKGFVLKPEFAKKRRGEQYFFVNARFFKSSYFNHAINKAYEGLLKDGAFPSYFLYLEVDPQKIDVNVHPTKTEIKFEEEKFIYSILLSSVRQALGKYNISPTLDFERETSFDLPLSMKNSPATEPEIKVDPTFNPFSSSSSSGISKGKTKENYSSAIRAQGFGQDKARQADWENFYEIKESDSEEVEKENDPLLSIEEQREFLLKGSYLFATSKSGIIVIQFRRAFEQILYEKTIKSFINNPLSTQKLLFPYDIEASSGDIAMWKDNEKLLNQLGFTAELENDAIVITGAPDIINEEAIGPCVNNILETLTHTDVDKTDIASSVVAVMARNASMGNHNLQSNELKESLLNELFQCEMHTHTNDGRKIIYMLSLDELSKKFES